MKKTGYLWDQVYLGHDPGFIYPEHPRRAEALNFNRLNKDIPGLELIDVNFRLFHWVNKVHGPEYISNVEDAFINKQRFLDKGETSVVQDTFDVASWSLSGALSLVQAIALDKVNNGFAAIRPPGHHAGLHNTRGFCYFNNAAACALFAKDYLNLERVMILDWDVHPGDGTAQIFWEDPSIYVFSIHQKGILSANIGLESQIGAEEGEGTTHNVNIIEKADGKIFMPIFEREIEKAFMTFKPQFLVISCGFDAHAADPLGGLNLNENDFYQMTKIIKTLTKEYCNSKFISVLEGGYNPSALYLCVREHIRAIMET